MARVGRMGFSGADDAPASTQKWVAAGCRDPFLNLVIVRRVGPASYFGTTASTSSAARWMISRIVLDLLFVP